MRTWIVVFLNKMLNKRGVWSVEAESQQEALARFRQLHRDFCQVISVDVKK